MMFHEVLYIFRETSQLVWVLVECDYFGKKIISKNYMSHSKTIVVAKYHAAAPSEIIESYFRRNFLKLKI